MSSFSSGVLMGMSEAIALKRSREMETIYLARIYSLEEEIRRLKGLKPLTAEQIKEINDGLKSMGMPKVQG